MKNTVIFTLIALFSFSCGSSKPVIERSAELDQRMQGLTNQKWRCFLEPDNDYVTNLAMTIKKTPTTYKEGNKTLTRNEYLISNFTQNKMADKFATNETVRKVIRVYKKSDKNNNPRENVFDTKNIVENKNLQRTFPYTFVVNPEGRKFPDYYYCKK